MEKHTCKLCFRRFSNGRALGGHMRSHITTTTKQPPPPLSPQHHYYPSPPSSSSSGPEDPPIQIEKGLSGCYRLRENPKKSFKMVDPDFSSSIAAAEHGFLFYSGNSSSMVVQDGESETESTKQPTSHRRRTRRRRQELEPVSSVSDTTPDEDVALCLMMLSRDVWSCKQNEVEEEEEEEVEEGQQHEEEDYQSEESDEIAAVRSRKVGKSRYQCGTCKKVFRSYQALGGHRASHKKVKQQQASAHVLEDPHQNSIRSADSEANESRTHECPFCFRLFSSGQALGGHKRSHLSSVAPVRADVRIVGNGNGSGKLGESFIDLNLPAPVEELSAVSDTGGN